MFSLNRNPFTQSRCPIRSNHIVDFTKSVLNSAHWNQSCDPNGAETITIVHSITKKFN